jgi:hypothetical protein
VLRVFLGFFGLPLVGSFCGQFCVFFGFEGLRVEGLFGFLLVSCF